MTARILLAACAMIAPVAAHASDERIPSSVERREASDGVPTQLSREERDAYRAIFAAIREARWADAQIKLDAMRPGLLHATARAELYLAKGSPKVELPQLMAVLGEGPELPQAEQLARLAKLRGATTLPSLPVAQRMIWHAGAPKRLICWWLTTRC